MNSLSVIIAGLLWLICKLCMALHGACIFHLLCEPHVRGRRRAQTFCGMEAYLPRGDNAAEAPKLAQYITLVPGKRPWGSKTHSCTHSPTYPKRPSLRWPIFSHPKSPRFNLQLSHSAKWSNMPMPSISVSPYVMAREPWQRPLFLQNRLELLNLAGWPTRVRPWNRVIDPTSQSGYSRAQTLWALHSQKP